MPPCAFDELFAWSEPFVASATRAPARSAETAAARPDAPLPMTSTSKEVAAAAIGRLYLIAGMSNAYCRKAAALSRSGEAAPGSLQGTPAVDWRGCRRVRQLPRQPEQG